MLETILRLAATFAGWWCFMVVAGFVAKLGWFALMTGWGMM